MIADNFFENVPNHGVLLFDQFLGLLNRRASAKRDPMVGVEVADGPPHDAVSKLQKATDVPILQVEAGVAAGAGSGPAAAFGRVVGEKDSVPGREGSTSRPAGGFHFTRFRLPFALMEEGCLMVRVGIAGIGFMGVTHYKALKHVEGAKVTAIFTRNPKKLAGDWREVKGNFGEAGGVEDLTGVKRHDTLEVLLSDREVDLVDLCLPTDLHPPAALAALAAGKHVLVEKPIALTVADAEEMIAAAERAGRLLMVGQVLRFFPEFAYLYQCEDRGEYGDLLAAPPNSVEGPDFPDDEGDSR